MGVESRYHTIGTNEWRRGGGGQCVKHIALSLSNGIASSNS